MKTIAKKVDLTRNVRFISHLSVIASKAKGEAKQSRHSSFTPPFCRVKPSTDNKRKNNRELPANIQARQSAKSNISLSKNTNADMFITRDTPCSTSWFGRVIHLITESELFFKLFKTNRVRYKVTGQCNKTGYCCQNLILVDNGKPLNSLKQFEKLCKSMSWYNMFVPRESSSSDGILRFSCKNITEDNLCGIHDTRPDICRRYPETRMVRLGGTLFPGCGYKIVPDKSFAEFLDEKM